MIKYPYAVREFEKMIDNDLLYVDRTQHIRFMEEWSYELLFMRPRRFGKSLWLSTLMTYYDIDKADDFERLFGHLSIGQEPTPLHNSYMVMRWDFSTVAVSGSIEDIQQSLTDHLNDCCKHFQRKYEEQLTYSIEIDPNSAFSSFSSLVSTVSLSGHKLYLFIDEYDRFANEVLMVPKQKTYQETQAQLEHYASLVEGEGLFKTLFKNLKSAGSGDGLDRIFMTGVLPIVLNDVTSGANTFKNISWRKELNDLCGFTHTELIDLVTQLVDSPVMEAKIEDRETELEKMMNLMESYCGGSLFIEDFRRLDMQNLPILYNPTSVFSFLENFQASGQYFIQSLAENLIPDDYKLTHIADYKAGADLLADVFGNDRPLTVRTLRKKFGMKDLLDVDLQSEHLAVLLCYLGILTCVGETNAGHNILEFPNLAIRQLYSE